MKVIRKIALVATALLGLTILPGCDQFDRAGQPPLGVAVPTDCENILKGVYDPIDDAKVAESALDLLAQYRRALGMANGRIYRGRDCIAKVREGFAAAGKQP